jgi:hypothetical protein
MEHAPSGYLYAPQAWCSAVRETTRRSAPSASASAATSGRSGRTWLAANRRPTREALR